MSKLLVFILLVYLTQFSNVYAKKIDVNSPEYLDEITQKELKKANSLIKSHHNDKANIILKDVLDKSTSVDTCLSIVMYTKNYGYPFIDIRRSCIEKAISLTNNDDKILSIIKVSRDNDFYDLTKESITKLLNAKNTPNELYDLCAQCQKLSLNDISQLCMKKAFNLVSTVEAGIDYAHHAKTFGMEEDCHKMLKALIDDDNSPQSLCTLLNSVQTFEMPDISRYLLKKALDESTTVQDYAMVWSASRKLGFADLQDVAAYRGKKLQLIQKYQQQ